MFLDELQNGINKTFKIIREPGAAWGMINVLK